MTDRLDPAVEGTGVGLAPVRRTVDTPGGTIRLESDGRGREQPRLPHLPPPQEPVRVVPASTSRPAVGGRRP